MSGSSRRVRRMQRANNLRKASPLNLVSLMDIFTILVFFLLVNSSSSPQLPNQKDLKLPTSIASKAPKETLVLVITPESLLVQGREVVKLRELQNSEAEVIEPLQKELEFQSKNKVLAVSANTDEDKGHSVTIMGDENISYDVLRKILATCQQTNYTQIAFAAQQKAKPKS